MNELAKGPDATENNSDNNLQVYFGIAFSPLATAMKRQYLLEPRVVLTESR